MRTRMNKPALLLSLLALGALWLVACGGDDDDQTTAASETETALPAKPSREQVQALKREANTWARLFSRRGVCNKYMGQPICVRLTPVSEAFQKSFADATVEDIKLKGNEQVPPPIGSIYLAAVKFSNGEVVMFSGGRPGPEPPAGSCAGPGGGCAWNIAGENRRFIQAATTPPS
jgi:hypothetical protein